MLSSSLPSLSKIVLTTLTEIDLLLNNYVYDGYSALSGYLKLPLGAVSTLYIALFGYAIMMGWVRMNTGNFVKAALKIGLIYMAVTQWSWISQYLVGLINEAISGMGDALISASPVHIPGADGIDGALQVALLQFTTLGSLLFKTGGFSNIAGWLCGGLVWGFGYLIVGVGMFEIILAKVMLAVLFVFTPLVVIFCYFKPFHGVFDRWLGSIVGFALLQLFVTAALALALSLSYWWIAAHAGETALQIGNYGTLPTIIIGIISIGLIFKAADLAQNLGGVISTSSASAMLGGMVGGAVGSSFGTLGTSGAIASKALAPVMGAGKYLAASGFRSAKSFVGNTLSSIRRGD